MSKWLVRFLVTIITVSGVAMTAPAAVAQTPEASPETPLIITPAEMTGLVQAVFRNFDREVDEAAAGVDATPAAGGTPVFAPGGSSVGIWVGAFDSAEHAERVFVTARAQLPDFATYEEGGSSTLIRSVELIDVRNAPYPAGAAGATLQWSPDDSGSAVWVVMRHDDLVVLAFIFSFEGEPTGDLVAELVPIVADVVSGSASDTEPAFDQSGLSTGGLWDVLPAAGDIPGWTPFGDERLWPVPD